jgi:rSAM/selenodomain-associated transferase 1
LRDTLDLARKLTEVRRFILFAPANESAYFSALAPDFDLLAQSGRELGQRLDNALTSCLKTGFKRVVVMNSDGPTLPPTYLRQAFALLDQTEAVFGPADDGGYYLVGLTRPQPRLLREVQMSTPAVLQDTLALANEDGVQVSLLPEWYDIDTINDLRRLLSDMQRLPDEVASHTRSFLRYLERQGIFTDHNLEAARNGAK